MSKRGWAERFLWKFLAEHWGVGSQLALEIVFLEVAGT
jgi:hypothetical protein